MAIKEYFKNLPDTTTPLTAPRLNNLLDGGEPMGNIKVDSIKSKNMAGSWYVGGINSDTGVDTTSTTSRRTDYIPVDFTSVSRYRLSGMPAANGSIFVNAYNSNKQSLGRTSAYIRSSTTAVSLSSNGFTSGTPQGTGEIKYVRICMYGVIDNVDIDNLTKNVQLEEGNSTTTFTESKYYGYISGSNENGNYIKYDDGTLMCYDVVQIPYQNTATIYNVEKNFPVSFVGANPICVLGVRQSNRIVDTNYVSTLSKITVYYKCDTNTGTSNVGYIAIGRWK